MDKVISFTEILENVRPSLPSLLREPRWDERRATVTQKKIRDVFFDHVGKDMSFLFLGGKGAGKTFICATLLAEFVVQNPDTIVAIVANTMNQVTDAPLPQFVDRVKLTGVRVVPRTEVRIDGKLYRNVVVIEHNEDVRSFVLLRSFENIHTIEGIELDAAWIDEVQDVTFGDFKVLASRLRGTRANGSFTPRRLLMATGLITPNYEAHFTSRDGLFDYRFVASTRENEKNLPESYIKRLKELFTAEELEMYFEGRPVSTPRDRNVFNFEYARHVLKDPIVPEDTSSVIISIDFNPAPMCATVYSQIDDRWICFNEIELWSATTYDLADEIRNRGYLGGFIIGDASGNKATTRSELTDFDILERELPNFTVIRGLMTGRTRGRTTYYNPPVRDTVRAANLMLERGEIVFNPSKLESGGAPASISSAMWDVTGGVIDKRSDRKTDPKAPRTHFADTFRYFAFFVKNFFVNRSYFDFFEETFSSVRRSEFKVW